MTSAQILILPPFLTASPCAQNWVVRKSDEFSSKFGRNIINRWRNAGITKFEVSPCRKFTLLLEGSVQSMTNYSEAIEHALSLHV